MHPPYRRDKDRWLIELTLEDPAQLFNTIDPSPFPQKDLDESAERFIFDAVQDFHHHDPLALCIHLPAARLDAVTRERIARAIQHYFAWRAEEEDRQRRRTLRDGRLALLIGVAFVLLCTAARSALLSLPGNLFVHVLAEGLLILGWVALWRPIDTFLYGWWPAQRRAQTLRRIAALPIEFKASDQP
jgi:hypothetical protein